MTLDHNFALDNMIIAIKIVLCMIFIYVFYTDSRKGLIKNTSIIGFILVSFLNCFIFNSGNMATLGLALVVPLLISMVIFLSLLLFYLKGWVGGGDIKILSIIPFIFNPMLSIFEPSDFIKVMFIHSFLYIPVYFYYKFIPHPTLEKGKTPLGVALSMAGLLTIWF